MLGWTVEHWRLGVTRPLRRHANKSASRRCTVRAATSSGLETLRGITSLPLISGLSTGKGLVDRAVEARVIVGVARAAPVRDTCSWSSRIGGGPLCSEDVSAHARPTGPSSNAFGSKVTNLKSRAALYRRTRRRASAFQGSHFTGRRRVSALRCERITWSSRCRNATGLQVKRISATYHARRGRKGAGKYKDIPAFVKSARLYKVASDGDVFTPGRYVGAPQSRVTMSRSGRRCGGSPRSLMDSSPRQGMLVTMTNVRTRRQRCDEEIRCGHIRRHRNVVDVAHAQQRTNIRIMGLR